MFSPPPAPIETDIRVHRPASEWKAPLFWSLLGAAALSCGVFIRSGGQIRRNVPGRRGPDFYAGDVGLSVDTKHTEISADEHGMRKTTAFGWRQIRWEQVGAVQQERTIFGRRKYTLRDGSNTSFPGREVTTHCLSRPQRTQAGQHESHDAARLGSATVARHLRRANGAAVGIPHDVRAESLEVMWAAWEAAAGSQAPPATTAHTAHTWRNDIWGGRLAAAVMLDVTQNRRYSCA